MRGKVGRLDFPWGQSQCTRADGCRIGRAIPPGSAVDCHRVIRTFWRLPALSDNSTHRVPVAERSRHRLPTPGRRVRPPPGTLGDRLTVGFLALNQAMKVRFLLPELPPVASGPPKGE